MSQVFDELLQGAGEQEWKEALAIVADSMFMGSVWFRHHDMTDYTPADLLKFAEITLIETRANRAARRAEERSTTDAS